jgi:Bacterial Ig-like domain
MKKSILIFLAVFISAALIALSGCSKAATTTMTSTPVTSTTAVITTVPVLNSTSPVLTNFVPAAGAEGVPVNQSLSATFTEAMNPATINSGSFKLMQGSTPVAGSVNLYGMTAVFNPLTDLAKDTTYTAELSTAIADMSGNQLSQSFTWTFTTGEIDTVVPYVISTIPAFTTIFPVDPNDPFGASSNVPVNDSIIAFFSEAMDPSTINTNTFTLMQGTTPVQGTVNFDGFETAIFTPAANLSPGMGYTATITTGAECLGGNQMAQNFSWSFTTGAAQATVPTVVSTVPANGVMNVPLNNAIVATFSEAINPMSINAESFTVMEGTDVIPGTVSFDGVNTAVFNPLSDLTSATEYTATITTDVTDLAGIHLASNYTWNFSTGQADTIQPTVISTNPADGATGVAAGGAVSITFSEGVNPASLVFTLEQNNAAVVPGTVTFNPTFTIVTFTPGIVLSSQTQYTASVSGWDLGSYGAVTKTWSFTTR